MIPAEIQALVDERQRARADRDFARADDLREQIEQAGFTLRDTPEGAVVERKADEDPRDPSSIESTLDLPSTLAISFHVLYEGFPADLERFLAGLAAHNDTSDLEVVVVDNGDGVRLEDVQGRYPFARALHLDRALGWAAARNAGLTTSRGELIALADLSVEPTGDIVAPVRAAFADDAVAVAGPFGLTTPDEMRTWEPSEGPVVDAIEGYLLVARRAAFAAGLIHEKFTWYRNADIDLSFQIRAGGGRAVTVTLPVRKHAHRGWEALEEDERARRSKRNHYIFFDRWKDRTDLLTR